VGQVKLERYGDAFLEVLRSTQPAESAAAIPSELPAPTTDQLLQAVAIANEPIQISLVAENINAVLLRYDMKKTSGMALNKLLLVNGYLDDASGDKMPTAQGTAAGITTIRRRARGRDYDQCLFNAQAQRLCAEIFLRDFLMA